jgi:hypothetical protein
MSHLPTKLLVEKEVGGAGLSVRTIIIDAYTNQGDGVVIGFRELDSLLGGVILTPSYSAGATTDGGAFFKPELAFNTTLSLTGAPQFNSWRAATFTIANQRIYCLFDELQTIDEFLFDNWHNNGSNPTRGTKNARIQVTDQAFPNTVLDQVVPNGVEVWNGDLPIHPASNTEQRFSIPLI